MDVSPQDAAAMFARACRAWYGERALRVVSSRVQALEKRGDAQGVAAWARVADVLSQTKMSHSARQGETLGELY
jgi:hypothetical protein